jgi:hypothetical protein
MVDYQISRLSVLSTAAEPLVSGDAPAGDKGVGNQGLWQGATTSWLLLELTEGTRSQDIVLTYAVTGREQMTEEGEPFDR